MAVLGLLYPVSERKNHIISYSHSGSSLTIIDCSSLTLDTPIEIKGVESSLHDVISAMQPSEKVRCETPFRASNSEAAFVRVGDDGVPFLHDVGTSTTYCLGFAEKTKLANRSAGEQSSLFHLPHPQTSGAAPEKRPYHDLIDDTKIILRVGARPYSNVANISAIIEQSTEWDRVFAYNEFTDELMLMRPVPGAKTPRNSFKPRQVKDSDFVAVQVWLQRHGFTSVGKPVVIDAVLANAEQEVISPVRHYLEGIATRVGWSPETHESRIHMLCEKYLGATADEGKAGAHPRYLSGVSRRFMVAAVARAFRPGCKMDTMLVLEGPQGAGKSTAIRILAGDDWFSDCLPSVGTKDASDHLRGKWFIELSELSAMSKTEVEATKAFISRQEERYRRPYDRSETTYKRRCVFVGTTNQDTYLRDETGNRRFWPVRVGKIDQDALRRDRDLLWAEAVYWYRQGKKWHMPKAVSSLAEAAQLSRVSDDIWQADLDRALEGVNEVSLIEAADKLLLDRTKMSRVEQNRLTACLKALGFAADGKFTKGEHRNATRYSRSTAGTE
jgi:predicted P-loop ATPase